MEFVAFFVFTRIYSSLHRGCKQLENRCLRKLPSAWACDQHTNAPLLWAKGSGAIKREILPYLFPPSWTETSLSWWIANGRAASKDKSKREFKWFLSELMRVPILLSLSQFMGTPGLKENANGDLLTSWLKLLLTQWDILRAFSSIWILNSAIKIPHPWGQQAKKNYL